MSKEETIDSMIKELAEETGLPITENFVKTVKSSIENFDGRMEQIGQTIAQTIHAIIDDAHKKEPVSPPLQAMIYQSIAAWCFGHSLLYLKSVNAPPDVVESAKKALIEQAGTLSLNPKRKTKEIH